MRFLRVCVVVALALAVSGCGAKKQSGSVSPGAELAPASAPVYIAVSTNPSGAQWTAADRLLKHFPGRDKLLAGARTELTKSGLDWERDVKPALPEKLYVVWVDFASNGGNVVGYAKPKDEAKFDKLLESGSNPLAHSKVDGWTVFSNKQAAIDRFETARASGDSLSGEKSFREAMGKVPANAAVRGWVSGKGIQAEIERQAAANPSAQQFRNFSKGFGTLEYATFSTAAEQQGLKVEAAYKANKQPKIGGFSPELDSALPSGALVYVSFGNLQDYLDRILEAADKDLPAFKAQRGQMENALGFSLKTDLFPLFSKEGAVAVYGGGELTPNLLFVLRVPDEAKARKVLERASALAGLGGKAARPVQVHGVPATEITISPGFSILAAVNDGKAFVTNQKATLEQALGNGKKLSDDQVYKDAREAAGVPDKTVGFAYVNLQAGLPYLFDFAAGSSPGSITPDVRANTKPLQSVYFFGKQDGDRVTVSGFLTIK